MYYKVLKLFGSIPLPYCNICLQAEVEWEELEALQLGYTSRYTLEKRKGGTNQWATCQICSGFYHRANENAKLGCAREAEGKVWGEQGFGGCRRRCCLLLTREAVRLCGKCRTSWRESPEFHRAPSLPRRNHEHCQACLRAPQGVYASPEAQWEKVWNFTWNST